MIRICAWCRRKIGEKKPLAYKCPTYEICLKCDAMLQAKYRLLYPASLEIFSSTKKRLAKTPPW